MAVSAALGFLVLGEVNLASVNILGNVFILPRPQAVRWFGWIVWAYWFWRHIQYRRAMDSAKTVRRVTVQSYGAFARSRCQQRAAAEVSHRAPPNRSPSPAAPPAARASRRHSGAAPSASPCRRLSSVCLAECCVPGRSDSSRQSPFLHPQGARLQRGGHGFRSFVMKAPRQAAPIPISSLAFQNRGHRTMQCWRKSGSLRDAARRQSRAPRRSSKALVRPCHGPRP